MSLAPANRAPTKLALIATAPVLVDRRAISQAWFDALHLAERSSPACARALRTAIPFETSRRVRRTSNAAPATDAARPCRPSRESRGAPISAQRALPLAGLPFRERRMPVSQLAQTLVARARVQQTGATFALPVPGGRVLVCVRRDATGLRLAALCPPAARSAVEAALAHARFALCARGSVVAW